MRPDPGARIYTMNNFLSEYAPVSGNYGSLKPYLGSDGLKSTLSNAADKVKSMYSNVLTGMKDSYKSIKEQGLFKPDYNLGFSYK